MIGLDSPLLTDTDADFIQHHGLRVVCLLAKNPVNAAQAQRLVCELLSVMGPV